MDRQVRLMLCACLLGVLVLSALGLESKSAAQSTASGSDDYSQPAGKDWPMVGGDWDNTRYSTLTQINTQNVKQLGAAWVSKKFDEGGTSRVTAVVKDGLMFVTAGRQVYALNPKTGEKVWSYKTVPDVRQEDVASGPDNLMVWLNSPNGVPNGRGVGVGQGLVFVGLQDGHVIALKEKTGELVWIRQTGIDQPKKGQWATAAPTYVNGSLFTGMSDGDHHQRGRLTAIDAETGKELWQTFSIPGPGEPGHETWPSSNDTWKFGGGGVWTNPSVDPALGMVYSTTGDAVPPFAGDWRPGNNLYTCSVLGVDTKTGKVKWYYQLVHHDVFEGDVGTPVILYDAKVGGQSHKALAALRADGYLFQLDRETGKPVLPVEERPVAQLADQKTSPTQPFPVGGESVLMSCDEWKKEKIPAGFVLGCMWTPPASPPPSKDPQNVLAPSDSVRVNPMAYSPQTGYFYAQGVSSLGWPRRSQDPYFLGLSGSVPGLKAYGEVAAIDSRTGKIAWKKKMPPVLLSGGPIATAGGLLFRSSGDGNFEAYDAKTGDLLWQFQTGMGGGRGSPSTYEVDGEQYVAIPMGPAVWAFKLGGQVAPGQAPKISTEQEEFAGPVVDATEIDTTSLERTIIEPGMRYFIDEFAFDPYRARVKVGAKVLFVNNGNIPHEITALDGSWGTGPLSPTQEAWVTFDKPGQYTYICKDHPWTYGQIIVVAADAQAAASSPKPEAGGNAESAQDNSGGFAEQAMRGKEQFVKNCSVCHGQDLGGSGPAPALSGDTFMLDWGNGAVGDLFDKIRTTMPQTSPGSLDRQTYLDIIAYLLQSNNLAPGKGELRDNPEALSNMKLGKK